MYIRKSFQKISSLLLPDTVLFLGDLFDGGREWTNDPVMGLWNPTPAADREDKSDEERWRKYGQQFWMKEYHRFSHVFFDTWSQVQSRSPGLPYGRRMIVDVPGNHDLGLGNGIRLPARNRFNAFFGAGNRIDVLGNHSFVSLDTVSLSAKGQANLATGATASTNEAHSRAIWEPVDEFLHNANAIKSRAIMSYLRTQNGLPEYEPQDLEVMNLADPAARALPAQSADYSGFPAIVLSHVPLYRAPETPCGPLRERFPPSKLSADGTLPEKDERNAIPYAAGKQYQNVLTPAVTKEIVDLVSDITHAFSGDDHDYCEVVHREYTSKGSGIREITVKSISWAMGVRHPGFQMVSLWNPVDADGKSTNPNAGESTVQSHLCLLPDQLSIFIRYALLLPPTIIALVIHAFRSANDQLARRKQEASSPLLPLVRSGTATSYHDGDPPGTGTHSSSSSSGQNVLNGNLSTRTAGRQSRVPSPGYGIPNGDSAALPPKDSGLTWKEIELDRGAFDTRRRVGGSHGGAFARFRHSMAWVAAVVLSWYIYLLRTS